MNSKQRSNLKKHARHYQIKKALLTTGITTLSVSGALLTSSFRTHAAEVPNELTTNQVNSMESSSSGKNEVALHNHDTQSSVSKAEESESTENISNNNSAKDADDAETDNNTAQHSKNQKLMLVSQQFQEQMNKLLQTSWTKVHLNLRLHK